MPSAPPGHEVGAGAALGSARGVPPGRPGWGEVESLLLLASLARIVILFIFTFEPCKACRWGRSIPETRSQRRKAGPPAWPAPSVGTGRAPPAPPAPRPRPRPPRVAGRQAGPPAARCRGGQSVRPGPARGAPREGPTAVRGRARGSSWRVAPGAPGRGRPGPRFPSLPLPPPPALRPSPSLSSLPALPLLLPGHVSPFFVCSGNNFSPLDAPRPDAPRRRRAGGGTGRGERRAGGRTRCAPGRRRRSHAAPRPPRPCRPRPRPPPAARRPGLAAPLPRVLSGATKRCPLGARESLSAPAKGQRRPRAPAPRSGQVSSLRAPAGTGAGLGGSGRGRPPAADLEAPAPLPAGERAPRFRGSARGGSPAGGETGAPERGSCRVLRVSCPDVRALSRCLWFRKGTELVLSAEGGIPAVPGRGRGC